MSRAGAIWSAAARVIRPTRSPQAIRSSPKVFARGFLVAIRPGSGASAQTLGRPEHLASSLRELTAWAANRVRASDPRTSTHRTLIATIVCEYEHCNSVTDATHRIMMNEINTAQSIDK